MAAAVGGEARIEEALKAGTNNTAMSAKDMGLQGLKTTAEEARDALATDMAKAQLGLLMMGKEEKEKVVAGKAEDLLENIHGAEFEKKKEDEQTNRFGDLYLGFAARKVCVFV